MTWRLPFQLLSYCVALLLIGSILLSSGILPECHVFVGFELFISRILGKNKTTFQPLCLDILNILKRATSILRIPLTATIWNLSSIRKFPPHYFSIISFLFDFFSLPFSLP